MVRVIVGDIVALDVDAIAAVRREQPVGAPLADAPVSCHDDRRLRRR